MYLGFDCTFDVVRVCALTKKIETYKVFHVVAMAAAHKRIALKKCLRDLWFERLILHWGYLFWSFVSLKKKTLQKNMFALSFCVFAFVFFLFVFLKIYSFYFFVFIFIFHFYYATIVFIFFFLQKKKNRNKLNAGNKS